MRGMQWKLCVLSHVFSWVTRNECDRFPPPGEALTLLACCSLSSAALGNKCAASGCRWQRNC